MNKYKKVMILLIIPLICLYLMSCSNKNSSLAESKGKTQISSASDSANTSSFTSMINPHDIQGVKPSTIKQLSKRAQELKGLTPEQVIRKYFEYFNKKDKAGVTSTLTGWQDSPNSSFGFERNFQWIKIIEIKPADDLHADNYMSNGRGSVNGVKRENVRVFKVDFETKYSKDTPPFPNGKAWDYFFVIKINDDSPWLIDDIGV